MGEYVYPFIIGFSGKIGSGKDYIAKEILGKYLKSIGKTYIHMAFSDAIKVHLMATTETTYEELYVKKTEKSRNLLQYIGMETRRVDDMIWIKTLDAWIKVYGNRGVDIILISDVRFPIEMKYIKERGGIIFRLISPERTFIKMREEMGNDENTVIKTHISETALDDYNLNEFDEILYNDNLTNDEILDKIKKPLNL
jgi:hypothetical protein